MQKEEVLQSLNEIKRSERELYLKRSELAALEAMERHTDLGVVGSTLGQKDFKEAFSKIIKEVGAASNGGDSVKDVGLERRR